MSSSPRLRRSAALLAALPLLLAGCGKKGDPMPAPRTIPQAATDLKVRQRGPELVLEFAYPKATVAGLPLPGLDVITLYSMEKAVITPAAPSAASAVPPTPATPVTSATATTPAAAGSTATSGVPAPAATAAAPVAPAALPAPAPAPAPGATPAAPPTPAVAVVHGPMLPDPKEFAVAAKPLLTLTGAELASAISGDRVTLRYRLPEPLPTPPMTLVFAVRTHATAGEISAYSNLAGLTPRVAPAPPPGFLAVAEKEGVKLSWLAGAAAETTAPPAPGAESAEARGTGFNLYRRDAARTSYGEPIAALDATALATVDTGAVYGRRYIYALSAIGSREPLVESALSNEREIDFEDRFAPAPPLSLSALGSIGEVRLVWRASPDPDVAGYVVERADPDGEFHRVNATPTADLEFTDHGLASGFTFRYRVAAIDKSGNLGTPGETASTRVP
ncbi:MAG: fibronectin type III domain-containing protein [Thermoanaerobaculia bacterium]